VDRGRPSRPIAYDQYVRLYDGDIGITLIPYNCKSAGVGTPYLCFALFNNGYHDTALKLLLQESYPGWQYSVSKGVTTIWEHWDSIKLDGSFWSDDMNSFNHYVYGAIGDWMYRKIAGLDMDASTPDFKQIHIEHMFGMNKLSYAKTAHLSMYGRFESGWREQGDQIEVNVLVPGNTTAQVVLLGANMKSLSEGGKELGASIGIQSASDYEQGVRVRIGSGAYTFTYTNKDLFRVHYTENSRLDDVLNDETATAVLKKHIPEIFLGPILGFMKKSTLKQITENAMANISRKKIDAVLEELATFKVERGEEAP
jgi:alpha-L-rhamnosidase